MSIAYDSKIVDSRYEHLQGRLVCYTLPTPDEAYQSLAIDFAGPFNKSNGSTTIMVIMDRFTSYTHLVPLKDAATSEMLEVVARFVRNVLNGGDVGVVLSCVVYGGCLLRFPQVGKTLLSTCDTHMSPHMP